MIRQKHVQNIEENDFMDIEKCKKLIGKKYGQRVSVELTDDGILLKGRLGSWDDIVAACSLCAEKNSSTHVINDIELIGATEEKIRVPIIEDKAIDGLTPDVLIIGGGISGASIARELTKWDISILLVEKEEDLAMHASGRNDGEVHPGVDLPKGSLKQKYVVRGNQMFDSVCRELGVPFERVGQIVGFNNAVAKPLAQVFAYNRREKCGVTDTQIISADRIRELNPGLNKRFRFGLYNPSAGTVCPFALTIAYGENAVKNGAKISLSTMVRSMVVEEGIIKSVETNRGTVYPKLVINAAGVFAEDIAGMAKDRFFSIHPRKGTSSITDRKAGGKVRTISSVRYVLEKETNSKGGGIVHTVHHNLLIGPNAKETRLKEDFSTDRESIDEVFLKQENTAPSIRKSDIITYFSGIRAATFEEDFILEQGRKTKNIIHCAGIQSPGLTTAPAVAMDISELAAELLYDLHPERRVALNPDFDPIRKPIPTLRDMSDGERDYLIKNNPDYGVIVCRCEEISKGEILQALKNPLGVVSLDGVKRRVRPGAGRCQGAFCMPAIAKIISELTGQPMSRVTKSGGRSQVTFGSREQAAEGDGSDADAGTGADTDAGNKAQVKAAAKTKEAKNE